MSWWSNQEIDPKRKNRFKIFIGVTGNATSDLLLTAVSVSKPTVQIEQKEYQMINHVYRFPGIAKWDPISITFIDGNGANNATEDFNTSQKLYDILLSSGYSTPAGGGTPGKSKMVSKSLGNDMRIVHVTPNGDEIEKWTLHNPIITKLSWGELDYGDDGLVQYSMDIAYDWATLE